MPKLFLNTFLNLLIFSTLASAQQFNFQNYSVTDGLAQSQVYAMLEDSRGYIWLGTQGGGLSRFDGLEFVNFSTKDSLANNYIGALYEDQTGDLWIGTSAGLSHFNGHQFTNYQIGEKNTFVAAITADETGKLWLGTSNGLFREKKAGQFERVSDHFDKLDGQIYALHWRPNGNLWLGGDFGAVQMKKGETRISKNAKHLEISQVRTFSEAPDGTMWIGTYGLGIKEWDGEELRQRFNFQQMPLNILALFQAKSDAMWIGTEGQGIRIWHPKDNTITALKEEDGLVDNNVRCILQDSWGNTWIGTSGGGISIYSGQQFVHFTKMDGLIDDAIYAIEEDSLNGRWYLGSGNGFSIFDGKRFEHLNANGNFEDVSCKTLLLDSQQRLWIGSEGEGLARYDSSGLLTMQARQGIAGNFVRDIVEDTSGNIWLATESGITRIEMLDSAGYLFNFKNFRQKEGLPSSSILDLHLDTLQRMWFIMAENGIGCMVNDSTIFHYTTQHGLPNNNLRVLTEDANGRLWVGTSSEGIARATIYTDSIDFQGLTTKNGLTSDNIYLLLFDEKEQLWVGSEKGIDRLVLDADGNINEQQHYGLVDGFLGVETCTGAAIEDQNGNLWFGTVEGLTRYNPRQVLSNPIPPKVAITQVRLFYDPLQDTKYRHFLDNWNAIADSLVFPHHENHLGFTFTGINHSNPEKVRYQWKMDGLENEWSPLSTQTNASYPNLPPGQYTFLVRAENEDGIFNQYPATVRFEILKPFWQEWWFILSAIGAILLLIGLFFRSRLNAVRRRAKAQQERLEMEKNLLELEQKALQLQMNPHFIFNALNSIQSQIGKQDNRTAKYQLAKFSKLMRAILENSRSNKISLEQEIETLTNYLTLEQFSRGNAFDFSIETPPDLDLEDTFIPPMMVQPFVENAIVHGVSHLEEKGQIRVQFLQENRALKCVVEDNGVGRERSAKLRSQAFEYHKSTALKVTQERLDILQPDGKKRLIIEDILDAKGQVSGTRVILYLLENQ